MTCKDLPSNGVSFIGEFDWGLGALSRSQLNTVILSANKLVARWLEKKTEVLETYDGFAWSTKKLLWLMTSRPPAAPLLATPFLRVGHLHKEAGLPSGTD